MPAARHPLRRADCRRAFGFLLQTQRLSVSPGQGRDGPDGQSSAIGKQAQGHVVHFVRRNEAETVGGHRPLRRIKGTMQSAPTRNA